jgi:hypothetical protein
MTGKKNSGWEKQAGRMPRLHYVHAAGSRGPHHCSIPFVFAALLGSEVLRIRRSFHNQLRSRRFGHTVKINTGERLLNKVRKLFYPCSSVLTCGYHAAANLWGHPIPNFSNHSNSSNSGVELTGAVPTTQTSRTTQTPRTQGCSSEGLTPI